MAILSRNSEPVEIRRVLPGDPEDLHSRYIEATVDGITIGCLYLPNGNPAPGPKFDYKLKWMERFTVHAAELFQRPEPVVLAGDYNVIPTARRRIQAGTLDRRRSVPRRDARSVRQDHGAGLDGFDPQTPSQRNHLHLLGFFRAAFDRNAGLRIDHLLLNEAAAERLEASGVYRDVRGWEKPSDHAPTWIDPRN